MVERGLLEGLQDLGARRHHVRGQRIGRARRHGRRPRPGRGAAAGARAWRRSRSSRRSRRSGCSRSSRPIELGRRPRGLREVGPGVGGRSRRSSPGDTLTIRHDGEVVAQLSASSLADDGPEYDRPMAPDDVAETVDDPAFIPFEGDLREALVAVLSSPNVASKRWIFEQYDSFVQGQTVASAGSDAAVIRVPGTLKGLALSSDGKGRFGHLDPYLGGRARRRGGRAQRRGHGREAARDHELPELRQPGAAGRDVAVRRGDPRDARRVPGVRHAGHRRERQLLQRVGRLGDLADAGDRHARSAGGLPPARADGVRARGACRSASWARRSPSSAGRSSPTSCSA